MKKFGAKKIGALAIAMALVTVGGVYATWTFNEGSSTTGVKTVTLGLADYTTTTGGSGSYKISTSTDSTNVSLIYTVDQYSDAITNVYNGGTTGTDYDYVITYYNSQMYVIYGSSSQLYYYTTDPNNPTQGTPAGINDHTAALCIAHNAKITITYTDTDSGSSGYMYGVDTNFSFSWKSGYAPTLPITNDNYYSSSGTETAFLQLDTSSYTIYATTTTGNVKNWSSSGSGVWYYELSGSDLFTYLKVVAQVIVDSTTGYDALSTVLSADNITLNITEAGDPLEVPTTTIALASPSNNSTIKLEDSTNASTAVSCYYVGFMTDATGSTPAYTVTVNYDTGTYVLNTAYSIATMLSGSDLLDTYHDGDYYIRTRAISASSTYANSVWTTATYYVTISGGTVTAVTAVSP